MSTSRELNPTTSSPRHSRVKLLPSRPVAPSIIALIFLISRLFENFCVPEGTSKLVLRRHDRGTSQLPIDIQFRIIPRKRTLVFGRVVVRCLVKHVRRLREHAKTVCESSRNPHHSLVLSR